MLLLPRILPFEKSSYETTPMIYNLESKVCSFSSPPMLLFNVYFFRFSHLYTVMYAVYRAVFGCSRIQRLDIMKSDCPQIDRQAPEKDIPNSFMLGFQPKICITLDGLFVGKSFPLSLHCIYYMRNLIFQYPPQEVFGDFDAILPFNIEILIVTRPHKL